MAYKKKVLNNNGVQKKHGYAAPATIILHPDLCGTESTKWYLIVEEEDGDSNDIPLPNDVADALLRSGMEWD